MFLDIKLLVIPALSTLYGFFGDISQAQAAIFPFSGTYTVEASFRSVSPDVAEISFSTLAGNADYELTQLNALTYGKFNNGLFILDADPAAFGLAAGLPLGFTILSTEDGTNKLISDASSRTIIVADPLSISGAIINIVTGQGRFVGAEGIFGVSLVKDFYLTENVTLIGEISVSGTFEAVPEPLTALGSAVAIGLGTFFKRQLKC